LNLAGLAGLGVRRVSVGSALARAAIGAFLRAAQEMRMHGTFAFSEEAVGFAEVSEFFKQ
jgi:2-methylisocitrate lyase-like PEP mutase family enzyme